MKATVVYANWDQIDRDTRLDVVGEGQVLDGQPELYSQVHVFEYHNGPVGPFDACEEMYALFNMPGGLQEKKRVRSMSVGDVVVLNLDNGQTEVYVCASCGFEEVSHLPQMGSWLAGVMG